MAEKTKILYATDVRETNTFDDAHKVVEVVELVNHEHVVDAKIEDLRNERMMLRALARLAGALPEESAISAVMRLVEEAEHYREERRRPLVSANLRQWVEEELSAERECVKATRDKGEKANAEASIESLERVARRIDEEEIVV